MKRVRRPYYVMMRLPKHYVLTIALLFNQVFPFAKSHTDLLSDLPIAIIDTVKQGINLLGC